MSGTARGDHPAGRGILRTNHDLVLRLLSLGFTPDDDRSTPDISAWSYTGIDGTLLLPAIRSMSDRCSESSVIRASSHIGLPSREFWSVPILLVVASEDDALLSAEELLDFIIPDRSHVSLDLINSWLATTNQVLSLANAASN